MVVKSPLSLFAAMLLGLLLSSCGGVKYAQMIMLDEIQNQVDSNLLAIPSLEIRTDDILNIQVSSRNPELVMPFQQQKLAAAPSGASAGENALGVQEGYRVDEEGNIYLPFVGAVKAAGKTTKLLREEINGLLVNYVPDASVQVRFMNFRITLLGEVFKPNTYIIPNERLTILEAIGMAGDFTPYAERTEVLVIRERGDNREFARVNTQAPDLFHSPYFYLSPNDIIYVEPLKAKQYATQGDWASRYSAVLVPVISFLTFVATLLLTGP